MKTSPSKITLSRSQDIPFNKLILSQANVRRIKAGVSVEQLAEDIARRGLLQSLNVRPVKDEAGTETGMYEIPAGGRRYRALDLLVKQKRMNKTQPVPCVVRTEGAAEEDSLAENVHREALHPLDQFRAFQTLREQGLSEEEIAARFFVTPAVVKQRLKLAAVSPKLLGLYAEDELSLEQLMAFTVTSDHARQEQVWEGVADTWNAEPHHIRRRLTEGAVAASDRRAQFVGIDTYEAAGGVITRDLFEDDEGGWLQDPVLLNRLVAEKLTREAKALRAEGWKWIEAAADFPYGHTRGQRRLVGETAPLSVDEQAAYDALCTEHDKLEQDFAEADELPEEVDRRLGEIETALEAFDNRPAVYDPAAVAHAGVFVSIDGDGRLRVERGYVRPEDATEYNATGGEAGQDAAETSTVITVNGGTPGAADDGAEEEGGIKPLPDRLVTELTAYRTLALRDALAGNPEMAFLAVLHALCLGAVYQFGARSCLEISAKCSGFGIQAPSLKESPPARSIEARHEEWLKQLPEEAEDLWDALGGMDDGRRAALFAHCAALSVNAVRDPHSRDDARLAHADQLARGVRLDLVHAGWAPTVDNYLGRVTKARILEAVCEARDEASAQLIDHLKKPDMAKEAERLLAGSGWLPEPLRLAAGRPDIEPQAGEVPAALPDFLAAEEDDGARTGEPQILAAE